MVRISKYKYNARCEKVTEMRLKRRDVEIAERYMEMEFRFYGREGFVMLEGDENFKYMGRPLDKKDDDWPTV